MEVVKLRGTILERHQNENVRAEAVDLKAVTDYNIMMGILEDPMAEEEEEING